MKPQPDKNQEQSLNDEREDDLRRRRKANLDAATTPTSGAAVSSAFAGGVLTVGGRDSETEAELKKATRKPSRDNS